MVAIIDYDAGNIKSVEKLGVMENSKEYVMVSLEMKEQGVL